MRYLLDVNTLIALGVVEHEFHALVAAWVGAERSGREELALLTCSITELGFVRILAQSPEYRFTTTTARALLLHMKEDRALFAFLADRHDVSHIPGWVNYPKQVTDGHLFQLAKAQGALLATLDRRIPGAFVIPG